MTRDRSGPVRFERGGARRPRLELRGPIHALAHPALQASLDAVLLPFLAPRRRAAR